MTSDAVESITYKRDPLQAERVNEFQLKYIDYMKRNKSVSRVIFAGPKSEEVLKIKWAQLAKELNSLGPPFKTVVQWQKLWRYLQSVVNIMKVVRNRSRVATKKISSLIPQSMVSEIGGQNGVSTVEKEQSSAYKDLETADFYLPVSHKVQTNEVSGKSRSSDAPKSSSVGMKDKVVAIKEMRKMSCLNICRKNFKTLLRRSPNVVQTISSSLNALTEYL